MLQRQFVRCGEAPPHWHENDLFREAHDFRVGLEKKRSAMAARGLIVRSPQEALEHYSALRWYGAPKSDRPWEEELFSAITKAINCPSLQGQVFCFHLLEYLISQISMPHFPIPYVMQVNFDDQAMLMDDPRIPDLIMHFFTYDRDTGYPCHLRQELSGSCILRNYRISTQWTYCYEEIHHWIIKGVTHEIDELLMVNGERRWDPHAKEEKSSRP